ncbi:MAG: hypothetical protein LBQ50_07765 [Planctomycetaceae bacterium]|jgi:hypothetical protein|nr:hypothetical protein [Planctomycetaceae bacterium]
MLRQSSTSGKKQCLWKTTFSIFVLLAVLLTLVLPVQAGRNIFRPEKDSESSSDNETVLGKKKTSQEQLKKLETVTQSIQQGSTGLALSHYYLFIFAFFVLGIILFYLLYQYYWERHVLSLDNPWNLFRELCTAHELNRSEQLILRHIAEEQHWDNPLPVFIEPSYLQSALNHKRFEKSRSLIESLLEKLFSFNTKNDLPTSVIPSDRSSIHTTTTIYRQEEAGKTSIHTKK